MSLICLSHQAHLIRSEFPQLKTTQANITSNSFIFHIIFFIDIIYSSAQEITYSSSNIQEFDSTYYIMCII